MSQTLEPLTWASSNGYHAVRPESNGRRRVTGAIVIGGDFQGLGIVRSLGRCGIPVCVVDDEYSISRFSRHVGRVVQVPDLRDQERTVDVLLKIGRAYDVDGWVLYPTRDETVSAFARHRLQLEERYRVPTPDWETIRWVYDKRFTYQRASELAIPTPRTWFRDDGNVELADMDFSYPVVIKPAIKEEFLYATRAKAWRADSPRELTRLYERAAQLVGPSQVMVQEFIPGDGAQQFAFCAFFRNGQALASMAVCRRRQHPPECGRASTFVQTVEIPELEALSEKFLSSIDYYGLVEVEYKRDVRTGEYKLLDVNARTWGYHSLGLRAGVDFPYLLFADQLGLPIERTRAKPGVSWIRMLTDFPTAVHELLGGRLGLGAYARSLRQVDVDAVFSAEDPLPGLAEIALVPYLVLRRGF
jgi:predicted ATP-grasp superfamily ATP-dependent carboligase